MGESLAASSRSWSAYIFPGLTHIEETVREKSFLLLDKFTATLSQSQTVAQHLSKLISSVRVIFLISWVLYIISGKNVYISGICYFLLLVNLFFVVLFYF